MSPRLRKCNCSTLLQLSLRVLTITIWNILKNFFAACKLENPNYLVSPCEELQELKDFVLQLPNTIKNELCNDLRRKAYRTTGRRLRRACVLPWLFDTDFKLLYVFRTGDYLEIEQFKKSLKYIKSVQLSIDSSVTSIRANLSAMTNIQEINFDEYLIDEDVLEIIGKNFAQIKVIRGYRIDYSLAGLQKLLFRTPVRSQLKNDCCNTIRVLDIFHNYFYDEGYNLNNFANGDEIFQLTFSQLPNLTTIGDYLPSFEHILKLLGKNIVLKISEVYCCNLTIDLMKNLKTMCPYVKTLELDSLSKSSLEALRNVNSIENICKLDIYTSGTCINTHNVVYESLLTSCLSGITKLCLNAFNGIINFTVFCHKLPNLENLEISNWSKPEEFNVVFNWDGTAYFSSLSIIELNFEEYVYAGDFHWIGCFAKTIEEIHLRQWIIDNGSARSFRQLVSDTCPKIDCISAPFQECNSQEIISIINKCDFLQRIGEFNIDNDEAKANYDEILEYVQNNNIDCAVDDRL